MATTPHFTAVLRGWREARRMTQFDLAAAADISPRHLSCLETGKAQAGRNVVLRLSAALEMPLRDCNGLLMAAGYAPVYPETALTTPPLAEVRRAIDLLLQKQLPYPAAVLDRHWNILQTNAGFDRIVHHVLGGRPSRHANMVRQIFDPEDVRAAIVNWEEVAGAVLRNLQHKLAFSPNDRAGHALIAEALSYPGVPEPWRDLDVANPPPPVLTTVMRAGDRQIGFFSTMTSFAMPQDVTLDEVRIECCFPTDDQGRELCARLASEA